MPEWTATDLETLQRLYGSMPTRDLAPLLGRNVSAIKAKASALGMRGYLAWSDENTAWLRSHYGSASNEELVAILGRPIRAIYLKAEKMGLVHRTHVAAQSIRHDYFGMLRNAEHAYVLGWLAADGSVSDRNDISIELNNKDLGALEWIRDQLAPAIPLRQWGNRPTHTLQLRSPQMARDLAGYGVVPRKTYSLEWPHHLPPTLEAPFLLGYFDGDGCARLDRGRYAHWSVTGQEAFLCGARAVLQKRVGVLIAPATQRGEHCWTLSANSARALAIDVWLHACGLGLPRKHLATLLAH